MKRLAAVCAILAVVCLGSSAEGSITPSWDMIGFDTLHHGAFSYNADGSNVVVSGSAFVNGLSSDGFLGTQVIGGDGINKTVEGNLAIYGVFHYVDTDNVLSWAMSNPNTLLALEIRARDVKVDIDRDGDSDFTERFTLDAVGSPIDFLTATFAELATWGYTELAPGVWMDIALGADNMVALSIVIDGFTTDNPWPATINANLLESTLGGPVAGVTPGSGVRLAAIPEPSAFIVWSLLGLAAVSFGFCRRKFMAK
jgi:hypothetical protein